MANGVSASLRSTLGDLLAAAGEFALRPGGRAPAESYRLVRSQRIGYADADFPRDCLLRLVDFPDLLLRTGLRETVKAGRSALVVRAEVPIVGGMRPVAYKRIRRRTWWKALTGFFRPGRAIRVWRLGHELLARGIATPRPLAVIVPRLWSRRRESWLVTEWLGGVENLSEFCESLSRCDAARTRQRLNAAADALGRLVGRMHAAGIAHRDLKATNLLLGGEGSGVQNSVFRERFSPSADVPGGKLNSGHPTPGVTAAWVIDLDGASLHRRVSRTRRARNLARLAAGLAHRREIGHALRRRFLRSYLAAAADADWNWKDAWRSITGLSRRLAAKRERIARR